jgi:hypothetical protein
MGKKHGHVASQGAAGPFKQERQPGLFGVGPQAPEAHLRDFRELPRVVCRGGPLQLKLHLAAQSKTLDQGQSREGGQGGEVEGADLVGADRHERGWMGHQEL